MVNRWLREVYPERCTAESFARPSHGSLICTFSDCPNRLEEIHDKPASDAGGKHSYNNFCHLGARRKDFSRCLHPTNDDGHNSYEWNTAFCEVCVREGVCPRGFTR